MPHRFALLGSVLALALLPAVAQARDGRTVTVQDRCDPATFNAVIGPGTCVEDGGVTFAEFLSKLNPVDGGHPGWRFSPAALTIEPGRRLRVRNEGGETHSFTEVIAFGATPLPQFALLNNALAPGTPFAVPVGDPGPSFVPAGEKFDVRGLSVGPHRFECLIHPWMRATVTVAPGREDDD